MNRPRLVLSIAILGVVGCALPFGRSPSSPVRPDRSVGVDTEAKTPAPIVQVRGYWRSPVVSVVAWDADDAAFGLRTSVTREGKLVGGVRIGDHSLYMTPFLVRDMGGFAQAMAMPDQLLLPTGTRRDAYSCYYGRKCSPMVTTGVRVPDSLLRANRDSLVVMFIPRVNEAWTVTLRRELIAAYLHKVDSVVADMNRVGAR